MKKIFLIYASAFVAVILIIAIAITSSFMHVNMTRKAHVEKAYATVTELASRENIDDLVLTIYHNPDWYFYEYRKNHSDDYWTTFASNIPTKEILKGEEIRPILESYKQFTPEQIKSVYPYPSMFWIDFFYVFETESEGEILEIMGGSSTEMDYETDTVPSQSYVIINGMDFEDHFNQFAQ
ncbi:MAG: hypothetical protein E7491_01420 [Ruminococcaceae bacterium]|nr:hypothetical protein [Oscillospiraceae bacterium]